MKTKVVASLIGITLLLTSNLAGAAAATPTDPVQRGRYLVTVAGCNDCHTAGFAPSGAKTPESEWLKGDQLGYAGGWGTTYAINLRQYMSQLDEKTWLKQARASRARPPMPVWALHSMSDEDLVAIYRFVRQLGPAGGATPAYLPPGQQAAGPVVQFPAPPAQ